MHPSDLSWTFAFVEDAVVVGRCQESPGDLLELSTFTSMYLLRVESAHFAEDTPQTFAVNIKDNITWIFHTGDVFTRRLHCNELFGYSSI